jgi:hypothetical protein
MELLLNLIWLAALFVSVGAIWFLPEPARLVGPHGRLRCAVLACSLLFLIFPVVSVSDDLGLLHAEIEECATDTLAVKKIGPSTGPKAGSQTPPLETATLIGLDRPWREQQGTTQVLQCNLPHQTSAEVIRCRAPPRRRILTDVALVPQRDSSTRIQGCQGRITKGSGRSSLERKPLETTRGSIWDNLQRTENSYPPTRHRCSGSSRGNRVKRDRSRMRQQGRWSGILWPGRAETVFANCGTGRAAKT